MTLCKSFPVWLLLLPFLAACSNPMAGDNDGFLPKSGEFPGLVAVSARQSFSNAKQREKYLGHDRAVFFEQHSIRTIFTRDYTFNGERLTMESFQIDSDAGASGIYYYYAGRQLRGMGKELDIGAQAVLDTFNKSRNLYFYKGRWFFSLIYTGKEPAPDMVELATFLVRRVPGDSRRPDGFQFLEVEGVGHNYARVTSGNALNFDIFPPGVTAVAPGAGGRAAAYVIDLGDNDRAQDRARDFERYLRVNAAEYHSQRRVFGKDGIDCRQALDGKHGKLVFARYGRFIVVVANVDDYQAGLEILSRILEKMHTAKVKK